MGPWESVPATPQRERGRAAGGSKGSGLQRRVEHRSGGAGWLQASGSSDGIRAEKIFPDPAATRRRRNASPDAFLRRHAPCCTAARSRPVAEAACPNLAATAVSLSIAPCQFRPDSCDVIGFVSQFFHRRRAPSARRALSAAIPRAQKTARLARRARAHGRIPPGGVLHDDSHSPGEGALADRRYGPRAATRTGRGEFSIS
jgi:hypothetical protein